MKHPPAASNPEAGFNQGTGYVWPTPGQQSMLRAALLPGQAGFDAWKAWIAAVDIDRLDMGSLRLIPLLYKNLKRNGIEHEWLGRFKGIYRRAWYENQMAMHRLSGLLRFLHSEKIPTLILKGAALAPLYYKDLGLRPMADLDVLVPVNRAIDTVNRLRESGWKPLESMPRRIMPDYLLALKAVNMVREPSDPQLDLHWHVFQECMEPQADDDLWEASIPVSCGELVSRALCPADQFLHVCAHAMEWNAIAPMRWVADAMMVLSSACDFDWDRVLQQARRRRLVLTLQTMAPYLRRLVAAPIPETVLRDLKGFPVTELERDWMKIRTRGISRLTVRDLFRVRFGLYRRSALSARFRPAILGFPRYMQCVWGMDHWWQMPMRGLHTIRRRLTEAA